MQIFIQHQGQQCGLFTVDQVRANLANRIYQLTDLAWHEGASGWLPLSTIPGFGGNLPGSAVTHPSATRTSGLVIGCFTPTSRVFISRMT